VTCALRLQPTERHGNNCGASSLILSAGISKARGYGLRGNERRAIVWARNGSFGVRNRFVDRVAREKLDNLRTRLTSTIMCGPLALLGDTSGSRAWHAGTATSREKNKQPVP
jgi:hypothetical protein